MECEKILDSQFLMTDNGRIDRVRDLFTVFNPEVDLEAMKRSGYLSALYEMMEPILGNFDDHSPEVIAYWAKKGMVKEFHGESVPMSWSEYERKTGYHWEEPKEGATQNRFMRWNSYVPVSAFDPKNRGRKYPLVIMLHGGFNPISIIDGWGIPQEAAKREWIVIAPVLELDDLLDEVLAEAKRLYPVDESRIYAAGFSYGGFMANFLGNKRPDVYAAVAPCGAPISNGNTDRAIGPEPQTPFDGSPRAPKIGTYMPVINVIGALDGHRFPIYDYQGWMGRTGSPQELLDGINSWARVNHARELTLREVIDLKGAVDISEEEKEIGLPLAPDCRQTVLADGIRNYIGDLRSEDGIVRIRIMCEMNMPHWPTPEMARQIFSFFSHFSRDPATKASIYTE